MLLLFSALVWWANVSIREAAAVGKGRDAPATGPTDIETVTQVKREMGDAMAVFDIDKLNHIYADDWATIGSFSEIVTKENLLHDFKSFHDKLQSFELGPMDVRMFGNVAVAHGSVTDKRTRDGKDTSGEFAWMNLLDQANGWSCAAQARG